MGLVAPERVLYRVRQFAAALVAGLRPGAIDERPAEDVLGPAELALFRRMTPGERRHSLTVLARVKAAGARDPALLAAALLHDVGKTRARLRLGARPLPVLARAFLPGPAAGWGQGEPRGWRRPFVVAVQHPRWGAEMAEAAGSPPRAVALIRAHQERRTRESPEGLEMLQAADDMS